MKKALATLTTLSVCTLVNAADPALETCRDRVMDYAYHWDHGDTEAFGDLFTADAKLTLGGNTFQGREAIVERMAAAEGGPIMRHLMSTVRVTAAGNGTATGVSYLTLYMAEPTDQGLPKVDGFTLIGEYHDTFRITPDGCRIAERRFVPVFQPRRDES